MLAGPWLIGWDGDRDPNSQLIYATICSALCKLLNLEQIEVKSREVEVVEAGGRRLPLSALSDGYLTTTGWFLDLLARWIELARRHKQPIGPDFLSQMRGLVLIDELDLHLHPRWQMEIISRIRKLLPQMSFVATTHNPLTLVGARAEEIWILEEHEGRIRARQERTHPLVLTGGQILERFFDIEDVYPAEVGRQLARYAFLAVHAARTDEEHAELESLRTDLAPTGIYLPPIAPRTPPVAPPPTTRQRRRKSEP
jgi:predicted ATP-binding protein involved in virulence